tara:strand:+ start:674 stop:3106 length:2433 start_codon:yes stop_codon:yes gene_type:complete
MAIFDSIRLGSSAQGGAYEIERSVRLFRTDNASFTRTPSSEGNRRKWTFSVWAKFSDPNDTNTNQIFSYQQGHVNHRGSFYKGSSGVLNYQLRVAGSRKAFVTTVAQLRDPSAWYHIVLVIDSNQGSSTDRVKIYINGDLQDVTYYDTPTSGFETWINDDRAQYIGRASDENGGNMYLAECNFIDGQAYDPTYFGETNSETGQWVPIKYAESYTGNSFYLKFDDNSDVTATTLGKDSSGLGNNWTPSNFNVQDVSSDTPTNNFCTMNPVDKQTSSSLQVRDGALTVYTGSGFRTARGTFSALSGKWYWEAKLINWEDSFIGITEVEEKITSTSRGGEESNSAMIRQNNGDIRTSGSNSSYGNSQADGDILGFALDMDNGKFYIAENGTWYNSGDPVNGTNPAKSGLTKRVCPSASPYDGKSCRFNFGQDDTFDGTETSQGNTDGNGHGKFKYAPPTGFLTLCSANLPDPAILLPNKHFAAFTYTGTGSSGDVVNITNSDVDFTPDWVWVKTRNVTNDHILSDAVRGGNKYLVSSESYAEQTDTDKIRAFIQNGFESGTDGDTNWSGGRPFVAWNWNAGGSTVTNTDGSRTSSVRANPTAGFSIVTYTGNGSSGATIGHGLGVAPQVIFVKTRTSPDHWAVYHHSLGNTKIIYLNLTNQPATSSGYWNNTSPSSSVFTVGNDNKTNKSGDNYVAYCFTGIPAYSSFGKYNGNGSSNGIYVNCGFRPAWIMAKETSSTSRWSIYDNKRDPNNPNSIYLRAQVANGDTNNTSNSIDFLSNGFKMRGSGEPNASGIDYVYFAFAELPYKNSNAK